MPWREHARGVRGLLGRMMERSEPEHMADPPRRIDRAGARRLMVAAGEEAGVTQASVDAGSGRKWTINAPSQPAILIFGAIIVGLLGASLRGPQHAWSSGGLLDSPPDSGAGDKESRMISKLSVVSVVGAVTVVVASHATASDAVQWRVEDGGNGHWYRLVSYPTRISWAAAEAACEATGSHLVSITSLSENAFSRNLFSGAAIGLAWVGAYQLPTDPEPNGFRWITGEPFDCIVMQGSPCNFSNSGFCQEGEDYLQCTAVPGPYLSFNDMCSDFQGGREGYIAEWSADCNDDNIVDFGQILDGTFADTNSNGVPDCCDQGIPCSTCYRYDLNLNGTIDGADLGVLLAFWGPVSTAFPRADINADGQVDGADLGVLLSNWGPCPQ